MATTLGVVGKRGDVTSVANQSELIWGSFDDSFGQGEERPPAFYSHALMAVSWIVPQLGEIWNPVFTWRFEKMFGSRLRIKNGKAARNERPYVSDKCKSS
jgi:hypothetical protein